MGEILRHITRGMRNAVIVGTPDFNTNNQYADAVNIENDIKISIRKVTTHEQRAEVTAISRERKSQLRNKRTAVSK